MTHEVSLEYIIQNEYRINVLEAVLHWILTNNQNLKKPSEIQLEEIKRYEQERLARKYPGVNMELVK